MKTNQREPNEYTCTINGTVVRTKAYTKGEARAKIKKKLNEPIPPGVTLNLLRR